MAGGDGKRWGHYLGVEKQYVQVDGVPIIERAKSMFGRYGEIVVADKGNILRNRKNGDIDKLMSGIPLWSKKEETIVIFGDVYWTPEAVKAICENAERDWFVYGRLGRNAVKRWNENFAVSFYPQHHDHLVTTMKRAIKLADAKLIRASRVAQWYRVACGKDGKEADHIGQPQENLGHFVVIDDMTEDFDYPHDYENWKKHYTKN